MQEPNLCLRTEVAYQQDPLLQGCGNNLFNVVPFGSAVHVVAAGQPRSKVKSSSDTVGMHSAQP